MKLSTIAVSVVAVIGAAAVGGSYFTGKMAEEKYTALIQQSNSQLKQMKSTYGVDMQIENLKFERGFFDSKVDYQFTIKADEGSITLNGKDTLFHGPFPLNRLKHGNIVPVLASWEGEISAPDAFKSAVQDANGVLGKDSGVISYSGETEGGFTLNPVKYADEQGELELTGLDMHATLEKNFSITLPHFKFNIKAENMTITAEDLNYQADIEILKDYPDYPLNSGKGSLKSVVFSSKEPQNTFDFTLNQIELDGKSTLEKDRIASVFNFISNAQLSTEYGKADLGKFGLNGEVKLDAAISNNLMKQLSNSESLDNPKVLLAYYAQLFEKDVDIKLNYLGGETEKGKNTFDVVSNTKGFTPDKITSLNDALNLFKQSSVKIKADIANLEELAKRLASIHEETKADPEKAAKEIVQLMLNNLRSAEFVQISDKDISFNLGIDQGKVKLNGKELSEEEIQGILMLLVFAGGASGM